MTMLWVEVGDLPAGERRLANLDGTVVCPSDGTYQIVADPGGLLVEARQADKRPSLIATRGTLAGITFDRDSPATSG
jgi:hypothetical protein